MRSGVVLSSQQKRDKHVHCFMFDDMLILKLKLVGLRDMLMHTRKSGEVKWRLIDLGTIKGAQLWPAYSGAKNFWIL